MRLFNYDPDKATDEANFRQTLADLTNSLTHAVTLAVDSNYTVFLGTQFSGTHPPRPFLPVIRGNGFGLGTLPDPTFGGLIYSAIPGIVEDSVEEFLARGLFPIPTIAPGPTRAGLQFQFPINTLKNRGYTVEVSTNLHDWTTSYAFFSFADGYAFADTNAYAVPSAAFTGSWTAPRICRRRRTTISPTGFLSPAWALRHSVTMPAPRLSRASRDMRGIASGGVGRRRFPGWWLLRPSAARQGNTHRFTRARVLTNLSLVAYDGQPFYAVAGTTYQIQVSRHPGGIKLVITAPPTLTVGSPQNGAASLMPANFTISASAADSDGSISN